MDHNKILQKLLDIRKDRHWDQFHDPKNLSMALSIETSELMEHFLWVRKEEISRFSTEKKQEISEEIADVFIYLTYLAHGLDIDIESSVERKLELNAVKYPIEKVKGSITKYNRFI